MASEHAVVSPSASSGSIATTKSAKKPDNSVRLSSLYAKFNIIFITKTDNGPKMPYELIQCADNWHNLSFRLDESTGDMTLAESWQHPASSASCRRGFKITVSKGDFRARKIKTEYDAFGNDTGIDSYELDLLGKPMILLDDTQDNHKMRWKYLWPQVPTRTLGTLSLKQFDWSQGLDNVKFITVRVRRAECSFWNKKAAMAILHKDQITTSKRSFDDYLETGSETLDPEHGKTALQDNQRILEDVVPRDKRLPQEIVKLEPEIKPESEDDMLLPKNKATQGTVDLEQRLKDIKHLEGLVQEKIDTRKALKEAWSTFEKARDGFDQVKKSCQEAEMRLEAFERIFGQKT